MLDKLEFLNHLGAQQAEPVRERRELKTGVELLGDGGTAHEVAAFKHERAQPALGEVRAAREAVVPSADDDRVVVVGLAHGVLTFRSGL
ncbi:unannotated protein [freshwater metagenome]|uniref:Unannotated protein n=1 Tax=freshwater metagenome TaxID=449393 RepID=A0A6J7QM52_9ZZZZ